jgi:hypothetical protein
VLNLKYFGWSKQKLASPSLMTKNSYIIKVA